MQTVDPICNLYIIEPYKQTTTGIKTMQNLISKLSKTDQRHIKLALIHANNGNMRMLDAMIRSANSRSVGILEAIKGLI